MIPWSARRTDKRSPRRRGWLLLVVSALSGCSSSDVFEAGGPDVRSNVMDAGLVGAWSGSPDGAVSGLDSAAASPDSEVRSGASGMVCRGARMDGGRYADPTELAFDVTSRAALSAALVEPNVDRYDFAVVRADPVYVSGRFNTGPALSQLSLEVDDEYGAAVWVQGQGQPSPSGRLAGWLFPRSKGARYDLTFEALGGACIPYTLEVDLDGCTDAFEDNDSSAEAKPLSARQDYSAKVIAGDDDFYDVRAITGPRRSCTLSYSVSELGNRGLIVAAFTESGQLIASVDASGQFDKTNIISWTEPVATLRVSATDGQVCQAYALRCVAE